MAKPRKIAPRARKQPLQARSKATVAALITATARVLVRDGYDHASTNKIAQEAGVSIGSLYQYFPTKEALVAGVVYRHLHDRRALLRETTERLANEPIARAVRAIIAMLIDVQSRNKKLERVILEQVPRVAGLDHIRAFDAEVIELLAMFLTIRKDEIRRPDLVLAARVTYLCVRGATLGLLIDRPANFDHEAFTAELTAVVVNYLTVDGPGLPA